MGFGYLATGVLHDKRRIAHGSLALQQLIEKLW
nr:MAG TPA: hypothetical protein [Caudoviricetes sp.]